MEDALGWEIDPDPPEGSTPECSPFPSLEEILGFEGGLENFLA